MTFDQAVDAHHNYLVKRGEQEPDAQRRILNFLSVEDELPQLSQEVRIVLASADFSKEVTTTVLWLNASGLDITCVRMRPHSYRDGRVFLDIQQVIPLPEAAEYQIAIQQKAADVRAERRKQARDFTKYDLSIGPVQHQHLSKRDFVFYTMQEAIRRGHTPDMIHASMPWKAKSLLIGFNGRLDPSTFAEAVRSEGREPGRYYTAVDELFYIGDRTYALTKMWNDNAEDVVKALITLMGEPVSVTYCRTLAS